MNTTVAFKYRFESNLQKRDKLLTLSKNENEKIKVPELFYWGALNNTNLAIKCFLTLSKIIKSNYRPKSKKFELDPIVTSDSDTLRFEGFSSCCGIYARIDILESGQRGEFLYSGTTNIDFNDFLIKEFQKLNSKANLVLSIGQKEVGFHYDGKSIIEKKVKLPFNWINGLSSAQVYLSNSSLAYVLNRKEGLLLFRTLKKTKLPVYLIKVGTEYKFTLAQHPDGIRIGGSVRLELIKNLIPFVDSIFVYRENEDRSVTLVLKLEEVIFTFSFTREVDHGFSGNAANQEYLVEDVNQTIIDFYNKSKDEGRKFTFDEFAKLKKEGKETFSSSSEMLASIGWLGYDNFQGVFFKRKLPFNLGLINKLNPRYVAAKELISNNFAKVKSIDRENIEMIVKGTYGNYLVSIKKGKFSCTCTWFKENNTYRGLCKHLLVAKTLLKNDR